MNYCDLETSQTAENKEEQQQMLKRIERVKDVQIFDLERKLKKSHVGKQHACSLFPCMQCCYLHVNKWYYTLDTIEANQELESINEENQQLQLKLATMLQMSNAKDWQIAQLEYKLRSQLMMLSSQSDYGESSKGVYTYCAAYLIILIALINFAEPQCYVSTIDSAVQADYLTIAPG